MVEVGNTFYFLCVVSLIVSLDYSHFNTFITYAMYSTLSFACPVCHVLGPIQYMDMTCMC